MKCETDFHISGHFGGHSTKQEDVSNCIQTHCMAQTKTIAYHNSVVT